MKDDAVAFSCASTRFLAWLVACVLPVRQYGYAFQAFSWMLRAEAGANILTKDGTLLRTEEQREKQSLICLMVL